jgi:organic hydroperoxide reductase OsmC/OhrA
MAHHNASLAWQRGDATFTDNRYSRRHSVQFDGGAQMAASSSLHVVPLPYSDAAAVDPEEMFVASLASCHMLWFLSIAAKRGFCVDSYSDDAEGVMSKNSHGKLAMTLVTLHPRAVFSGEHMPTRDEIVDLHRQAHEECFIANSVTTELRCEPDYLEA